jgi:hypothetical protein
MGSRGRLPSCIRDRAVAQHQSAGEGSPNLLCLDDALGNIEEAIDALHELMESYELREAKGELPRAVVYLISRTAIAIDTTRARFDEARSGTPS